MKRIKIFASLAFGFLLFSGCSAFNKKQIEFYTTKPENVEIMRILADRFMAERNDGTVINVTAIREANIILRYRATKNDIPDVLALGGDQTFSNLTKKNNFMNLSKLKAVSKVHPNYIDMICYLNGDHSENIYALPYATNASGIIYNKEIFQRLGLAIPKTWSEFVKTVEKLKANGVVPFELTFYDEWTTLPMWNSMVPVLVPSDFSKLYVEGKITFEESHKEILEKYIYILKNSQGRAALSTSYSDGCSAFANGKAAMLINGTWAIPEIRRYNPEVKIDMFAFPVSEDSSKNTVTSGVDVAFAISETCKNKKLAREFVEFMFREDVVQKYIDDQFAFSTQENIIQSSELVNGIKNVVQEGRVQDFPDHQYPINFDLQSILSGFAQNYMKGVPDNSNITATLIQCDKDYSLSVIRITN